MTSLPVDVAAVGTGLAAAGTAVGATLNGATLAQKIQLVMEAVSLLQVLIQELPPMVNELKSKDDLLTKIQVIVADIEKTPADVINQVKQLISDVQGVTTA